jgi:hypothetical protein
LSFKSINQITTRQATCSSIQVTHTRLAPFNPPHSSPTAISSSSTQSNKKCSRCLPLTPNKCNSPQGRLSRDEGKARVTKSIVWPHPLSTQRPSTSTSLAPRRRETSKKSSKTAVWTVSGRDSESRLIHHLTAGSIRLLLLTASKGILSGQRKRSRLCPHSPHPDPLIHAKVSLEPEKAARENSSRISSEGTTLDSRIRSLRGSTTLRHQTMSSLMRT